MAKQGRRLVRGQFFDIYVNDESFFRLCFSLKKLCGWISYFILFYFIPIKKKEFYILFIQLSDKDLLIVWSISTNPSPDVLELTKTWMGSYAQAYKVFSRKKINSFKNLKGKKNQLVKLKKARNYWSPLSKIIFTSY